MAQGDYNRLTHEQFLIRAVAVHGKGRYDYSLAAYYNSSEKIKIICPTHGLFEQLASSHMKGLGCRKCGQQLTGRKNALTQEQFIAQATARHGSKYDYSRVCYLRSNARVIIICPEHGEFAQTPLNHAHSGNGCPRCGAQATGRSFLRGGAYYLAKFQAVHGTKFNYDRLPTEFKASDRIEIGCPVHGYFLQNVFEHASGGGCMSCARENLKHLNKLSWLEQAAGRPALLYFLKLQGRGEEFYKVGITYQSIEARFQGRKALGGYSYELLALHKSNNPSAVWDWEQSILETFAHLRYRPKKNFGGVTECFSNCEEILAIFPL